MNCRAIAGFATILILVATASLVDKKILLANGYEQSQTVSQTNQCGNYCSNINSQIQGDENNVAVTAAQEESSKNFGPPFP